MVNNLNIFKALVLLIFGINNIFSQSAEEILKKAQENSLILSDSYYKFKIESKLDNPMLPITGELFIRGENTLLTQNILIKFMMEKISLQLFMKIKKLLLVTQIFRFLTLLRINF